MVIAVVIVVQLLDMVEELGLLLSLLGLVVYLLMLFVGWQLVLFVEWQLLLLLVDVRLEGAVLLVI